MNPSSKKPRRGASPSSKSHTRSASTNVILVKMTRPFPRMRGLKRNLEAKSQYLPLVMTKHLPMDTTGLINLNTHHFPETVGKLIPRHISQVGLWSTTNRRRREPRPKLDQRTCHLRLKNPRLIRNQPVNHPSKNPHLQGLHLHQMLQSCRIRRVHGHRIFGLGRESVRKSRPLEAVFHSN